MFIKQTDALEFLTKNDAHFDFAIVSYVLHEMKEEERDVLLYALSNIADKIIVVDYLVPQPRNYCRIINELVEYGAGPLHYRNFKSFVKSNGITGLLEKVPLNVLSEVRNQPCSSHITVLEGKTGRSGETHSRNPMPDITKIRVKINETSCS